MTKEPDDLTLPRMLEDPTKERAAAVPLLFRMRAPAPGYDWCCWNCGKSWRGKEPNLPPPSRCPKCHSTRWWWRQVQATELEIRQVYPKLDPYKDAVPAFPYSARESIGMPLPPPPFLERDRRERTDPAPENQIEAAVRTPEQVEPTEPPPPSPELEPTPEPAPEETPTDATADQVEPL